MTNSIGRVAHTKDIQLYYYYKTQQYVFLLFHISKTIIKEDFWEISTYLGMIVLDGGLDEVRSGSPKGSPPPDLILTSIWSSTSSRTWRQYDLFFVSRKKSVQCKLRSFLGSIYLDVNIHSFVRKFLPMIKVKPKIFIFLKVQKLNFFTVKLCFL